MYCKRCGQINKINRWYPLYPWDYYLRSINILYLLFQSFSMSQHIFFSNWFLNVFCNKCNKSFILNCNTRLWMEKQIELEIACWSCIEFFFLSKAFCSLQNSTNRPRLFLSSHIVWNILCLWKSAKRVQIMQWVNIVVLVLSKPIIRYYLHFRKRKIEIFEPKE